MVIFKQVFPIAVAMMIYLHTANTLRGIQVLLTVKKCKGSYLPLSVTMETSTGIVK